MRLQYDKTKRSQIGLVELSTCEVMWDYIIRNRLLWGLYRDLFISALIKNRQRASLSFVFA